MWGGGGVVRNRECSFCSVTFFWGKKITSLISVYHLLINQPHHFVSLRHPHCLKFKLWIVFWCHCIIMCRGNNLDLHSGGFHFKYLPGHWLSWPQVLYSFPGKFWNVYPLVASFQILSSSLVIVPSMLCPVIWDTECIM